MPSLADIGKAKAFALWVKSAIGEEPGIFINDDPDLVEIQWSVDQRDKMIAFLDKQVWDRQPSVVHLNIDKVLLPWALRYLVPGAAATFVAGMASKGIHSIGKRFRLF